MADAIGHTPVLLAEVLELLAPKPGATIVDCTVGRGGHSAAILERISPGGTLIGLDADPRNLEFAAARLRGINPDPDRVRLFHANFSELEDVLSAAGVTEVDGILADLGLSTNHILDESYGLSFAADGPLDMRIDPRVRKTAADLVNRLDERELADLIYHLSDERFSRRIARKIGEARAVSPIKTTRQLAELVRDALPPVRPVYRSGRSGAGRAGGTAGRTERIDPATRTFMALRMAVNSEPENLAKLLEVAPRKLRAGGRLAVISFHSVEDRAVKQAFRSAEQTGLVAILTKKPLTPSDAEIQDNPRSRSAKLRGAEKKSRQ